MIAPRRLIDVLLFAAMLFGIAVARAEVKVGERVPAFDTRLLDGKTISFASLRKRPVLVVFWATWCPPCYGEMIELQQVYERYRERGLEIIAISVNAERDRAAVNEYLGQRGFTYPTAMSAGRHSEIFGPFLLPPRLFLIDRDGRLVLSHWGPIRIEALESTLQTML